MECINRHMIYGFLGHDPAFFVTPGGEQRCSLIVGTKKTVKDSQGKPTTAVQWHRVIVYPPFAKECKTNLQKNQWVFVEGEVQHRVFKKVLEHVDRTENVNITEIHADSVRFMGGSVPDMFSEPEIPFNG